MSYYIDMSKPLVSVIIPVWNTGDNVRQMISAVLAQDFEDFELILVNDGSSDDTLSVLKDVAKTDKRIKVFTKENGGPSSARNLGLDKAEGKYIQFYDADDDVASDALSITVGAMSDNVDVVVSGWQIDLDTPKGFIKDYKKVSPAPDTVTHDINQYVLKSLGDSGTLYNLWNKLFRANIIRKHKLRLREDLRFGEDLLFSLECFRHTSGISIIPQITYHYRSSSISGEFSSSSLVPEYRVANDEAIVAFAKDKDSATLQWLRWRWLMSYWSLVAGSKKSFSEKISLIGQFRPKDLHIVTSRGIKVLLMTTITACARTTTLTSLMLGWAMKVIRQLVIAVKSRLRSGRIAI